ncbi:MAG: uracil-DNA glycosylase [Micrococcales bacterium]|nr:uracil-DNA glycosylase [Micrococcales bacterium]
MNQQPAKAARPLDQLMDPSWASALAPVEPIIRQLGDFLRSEVALGRGYLPAGGSIFRAFAQPISQIKVLIVGQDPYPNPGHPVGLSFSVAPQVHPLPPSLRNIFSELVSDLRCPLPSNGDLSLWAQRGVMLLNRVLTVQTGLPASHRGKGWEKVTDWAIETLAARPGPLVAILWGREAAGLESKLGRVPTIKSAHPSPLSAHRGFFGSRPFSRANELLVKAGGQAIDWTLP